MTYKIALILKGICERYNYRHHSGYYMDIDWKFSRDNIKSYLVDDAVKRGYIVDVYISTYNGDYIEELKEFYNPKSVYIVNNDSQNINSNQLFLTKEILKDEVLLKTNYDFYIITRPDIEFKQNIYDLINLGTLKDVIRVPWRECVDNLVGDCIISIPKSMINIFRETIEKYYLKDHLSFHYIAKEIEAIKFMIDGLYDSNTDRQINPIYTLKRVIRNNKFIRYLPARHIGMKF